MEKKWVLKWFEMFGNIWSNDENLLRLWIGTPYFQRDYGLQQYYE